MVAYGFDEKSKEMITEVVRLVLAQNRNENTGGKNSRAPLLNIRLGKTNEAIDKGDEGEVTVYEGTDKGSETETDTVVTVYNRFGDLEDDVWVLIVYLLGGWEIYQGEC